MVNLLFLFPVDFKWRKGAETISLGGTEQAAGPSVGQCHAADSQQALSAPLQERVARAANVMAAASPGPGLVMWSERTLISFFLSVPICRLGPDIMLSEREENAVANSGSMCEQSVLTTSAELSEVRALQLRIDNAAKEREKCMREYRSEVEGVGAWRACAKHFYHEARNARKPLAQQRQQQHADFDGRDRDQVFDDVDRVSR